MVFKLQPTKNELAPTKPVSGQGYSAETFADDATSVYPALWTLARSIVRSAEDAEDVVQEALITGLGKRDEFEPGTSFLAWMGTIVRWTAMNRYRYESRRKHAPIDGVLEPAAQSAATPLVDPRTGQLLHEDTQSAFDDALTHALERLSPVARGCLMLRTQHDLDYQSIGEAMQIPANTAMSHVHRARQALRKHLSQHQHAMSSAKGGKR